MPDTVYLVVFTCSTGAEGVATATAERDFAGRIFARLSALPGNTYKALRWERWEGGICREVVSRWQNVKAA